MSIRLLQAGSAALALILCAQACRLRPPLAPRPVPGAASEALREADEILRSPAFEEDARASEREARAQAALERALALAPGWVAPRRLLDESLRNELRGIEALSAHLARLAENGDDASELYLAGRLEGLEGVERFERAVRVDPDLAWGHHGLAWAASVHGDASAACKHAARALERARDPWERTFFATNLARFLVAAGKREKALALLDERLHDEDLAASQRTSLSVVAVGFGLEDPAPRARAASYERGLELLRTSDLADAEVADLALRMRALGSFDDPDGTGLQLALAARPGPARDRARAELMLDSGATSLALGLFERALGAQGRPLPAGSLVRAARFAAGDFAGAVELWRASLPAVALGADGLPVDERLARVVRAARAFASPMSAPAASKETLGELGEALIAAGWFREARGVATRLAAVDLDRALSLESRGLAGLDLVEGLRRALRRVDRERATHTTLGPGQGDELRTLRDEARPVREIRVGRDTRGLPDSESPPVKTLDGLLSSVAPLVARADVFLGGDTDVEKIASDIESSPRVHYAGLAEVVHPGPVLSKEDEREGLGRAGTKVGGLAEILARFGRFALFGQVTGGGGPDATVLPLLCIQARSGVHLGVPWRGEIAYCESADLKSRAGRRGAQIAAAALHEGYWVDVDAVRGELAAWGALRARFAGADSRERVAQILASRGLVAETPVERLRTGTLLGEAQRLRLAVLAERASGDPGAGGAWLGKVGLDEVLTVTGNHEEGHLCDRTRFLPIGQHKLAILGLLFDCGFSPTRVAEELEYRAQLTCIAVAAEPRIALAQVLDSAESGPAGITPHAAAYARLLGEFVEVLQREWERDPKRFEELDAQHVLAHQLHVLKGEEVRAIALELARKKGMVR